MSRTLLIAAIIGGMLVGVALFAVTLVVVALDGSALSGSMMTTLALSAALGWVLDATGICLAWDRLRKLDDGSDGKGGQDGWDGPKPDPWQPRPPSADPEWWPEFERNLRSDSEARDRAPVPG